MLGRNGNIAYVRYNSQGRIVPGGPIISPSRPKVGNWQPLSLVTGNSVTSNSLRAFVRIDAYGRVVPSSLLLLSGAPSDADSGTSWLEINATYRPQFAPTTSTTTTSTTLSPSTTTTTSSSTSTTTSTTTTLSFAWTVSSSSVSNRIDACNYGFDYGRQTLWASTTDPNTVSKFYTDQSLTQVYQGNINDYYVYMMGWPSGQLYVAQMNPGGDLTSQQTCSSSTTTTTTTSPYKTFMFYSSISGDLPTICALSGTLSGPWYFTGPGTYPTVGDTIYWSPGFPYALNGAWMKIANGHAINGDANGYITQDAVC